jgi:hypothetical protein
MNTSGFQDENPEDELSNDNPSTPFQMAVALQ